jgi:phospholipid-transporting ATPase
MELCFGNDGAVQIGHVLEANNTLLRGCVLRNVEFVYGIVVYTGDETKVWNGPCGWRLGCFAFCLCIERLGRSQVRVKQSEVKTKRPTVEHRINQFILVLVILQAATCTIGAIMYTILIRDRYSSHWYLGKLVANASGAHAFLSMCDACLYRV